MTVALASLDVLPYLSEIGLLPSGLEQVVGIYVIRDNLKSVEDPRDQVVRYIGYSRDIAQSLKLHLVRQPSACYWLQVLPITRPSRQALEAQRQVWFSELGYVPEGNQHEPSPWEVPVDIKTDLSEAERVALTDPKLDDVQRTKRLKQAVRDREAILLAYLAERNCQLELRFNPKLKEQGLLDLKT